ncbi:MAG TPA: anthrone oxygenase family protein [Gammaproteobacteria bacterium]
MKNAWITGLLWFSAVGCGVMAGVYFAFSVFVMTALSRIDQASGVAAMNSINTVILRSLFMPLFFGTTVAALILAAVALLRWGAPGAPAMLVGGAAYVLGMFVVTMLLNVPLNSALQAAEPSIADAATTWGRYLREWTMWNHIRTVASTAACALFIFALAARIGTDR